MAHVVITSRAVGEDVRLLRRRRAMLCLSEHTQRAHELLNANIDFGPETQLPESEAGGFPLALREAVIRRIDRLGLEEPVGAERAGAPKYHTVVGSRGSIAEFREPGRTGRPRHGCTWHASRQAGIPHGDAREPDVRANDGNRRARVGSPAQGGRMMLMVDEGAVDVPVGEALWRGIGVGQHYMGTTRMSDRPTEGVVNGRCQVHGVSNLYVAGSAVFPTVGMANPTFTIVALALRMAEHIAKRLAK